MKFSPLFIPVRKGGIWKLHDFGRLPKYQSALWKASKKSVSIRCFTELQILFYGTPRLVFFCFTRRSLRTPMSCLPEKTAISLGFSQFLYLEGFFILSNR